MIVFALEELITLQKKDKIAFRYMTIFGANMGGRLWIYRDRLPTFQKVMMFHIEF